MVDALSVIPEQMAFPDASEFDVADADTLVNVIDTKYMKRPKLLFFDVNETLLDLSAMKASVAHALGGRADLLPLWFTTLLQYSLAATVGDNYEDFGEIGAATLTMVARNNGVALSLEDARQAMLPIRSLPPHPDVISGLDQLSLANHSELDCRTGLHA